MNLQNKGEIYMIISPCGKKYIGQVKCYYNLKGKKVEAGLEKRWKNHISSSKINDSTRGSRYLINAIKKYGAHNFKIKPIFICEESKLDYYETKFIRQYNTLVPNGMNIMTGGKSCKLSEETKLRISQSRIGRFGGKNNPNYGKKVSEETRQKIRETQLGRKLPESVKENMRKAALNKIQPRRKYLTLPKYIYHVSNSKSEGYEVRNHPIKKNKKFVSNKISMDEKLTLAQQYLIS